jgi:hypothetical protein
MVVTRSTPLLRSVLIYCLIALSMGLIVRADQSGSVVVDSTVGSDSSATVESVESARFDSSEIYIYDLSSDPYEATNIYGNEDSAQLKIIEEIEDRVTYWSQFYTAVANEGSDREAYTAAGGYASWVDSDFTPLNIDQVYSTSSAPHIVYVLVDDWGWNDFGSRSTYMSWTTPTIDALASEGVSLSNFYTNEVCAPSRASLMTGRYAFKLGFQSGVEDMSAKFVLNLTEITLAQELRSAGYRNYMVGKWVSIVVPLLILSNWSSAWCRTWDSRQYKTVQTTEDSIISTVTTTRRSTIIRRNTTVSLICMKISIS